MWHLLKGRKAECEEPSACAISAVKLEALEVSLRLWRCHSKEAGQQLEAVPVACITCCCLTSMGCFSLWINHMIDMHVSIRISFGLGARNCDAMVCFFRALQSWVSAVHAWW